MALQPSSAALRGMAEALASQTLDPKRFEWVVCLSDSHDGLGRELEGIDLPFALKIIESAERWSLGRARNACAARTCGSILLFSDAGSWPLPGTLAAHVAEQERGLCAAVGGVAFDGGRGIEVWRPTRVGYWNFNGINSSVPAVTFRQVGGFDEGLMGFGGEDLELGYRLARVGLPFRALPSASAVHQGLDPRRGGDLAKARAAGTNAARLAARQPALRWRLGVHPVQVTLKRWLFAVGLGPWFQRLGGGSVAYERAYLEGACDREA